MSAGRSEGSHEVSRREAKFQVEEDRAPATILEGNAEVIES